MTQPDPLAALLHEAAMSAWRTKDYPVAPWPMDMFDFIAARLRAAGVTLARQPDEALDVERLARALCARDEYVWDNEDPEEREKWLPEARAIARAYEEAT